MSEQPQQARAWISFDSTPGTPTIGAAFNATLTDDGVGLFTVNFTVAFGSSEFAFAGGARYDSANAAACALATMKRLATATRTTTTAKVQVVYAGSPAFYDSNETGFVFVGLQ